MKTQILYQRRLLTTVTCSPNQTWKALQRHFNATPEQLMSAGLSINPPSDGSRDAKDIIADCTEPDGSVWGVRFFNVLPPGYLVSPTSLWVWETATQVVREFSNSDAVRNHHGFHAAWPEDLQRWIGSTVDHSSTKCKALVKGHGDIVVGTMGFRSSKMTVMQAYVKSHEIEDLRRRYPTVGFQTVDDTVQFNDDVILLDLPYDLRKIAKWLREKSLKALGDEF